MTERIQLPVIPQHVPTHDNTMWRDWARCPRLYAIHHVRGWRSRKRAIALDYGTLFHSGLEAYYKAIKDGEDVAKALFTALEVVQSKPYVDNPDDFRTKGRALVDLKKYVIHYKGDLRNKVLLTETFFDVEDEEGFRHGGKLDLTVDMDSRIFPTDHKTTTRFGAFFYENYKLDPQMKGYAWGVGRLTGKTPPGVLINTIILHKKETKFDRKPVLISEKHIARWRERNIQLYHQVGVAREKDPTGEHAFDQSIWTPRYENCVDRYGTCPMYEVCSANPQNAEIHLRNHFEPGKWDFANVED